MGGGAWRRPGRQDNPTTRPSPAPSQAQRARLRGPGGPAGRGWAQAGSPQQARPGGSASYGVPSQVRDAQRLGTVEFCPAGGAREHRAVGGVPGGPTAAGRLHLPFPQPASCAPGEPRSRPGKTVLSAGNAPWGPCLSGRGGSQRTRCFPGARPGARDGDLRTDPPPQRRRGSPSGAQAALSQARALWAPGAAPSTRGSPGGPSAGRLPVSPRRPRLLGPARPASCWRRRDFLPAVPGGHRAPDPRLGARGRGGRRAGQGREWGWGLAPERGS